MLKKVRAQHTAQQSLSLEVPAVRAEFTQASNARPAVVRHLWLGVYLPALALEAVMDVNSADAFAVVEDQQGLRRVLLTNAKATAAGICRGMSVNAALALLPVLSLAERNPAREEQVLIKLVTWAKQFTSFVSIEKPAVLLLEIAGSLRLFGGLGTLRRRISGDLQQQGFTASLAIAPTPLAATWLARAGNRVCIRDRKNLTGALSRLPLSCLDWPEAVCESLQAMGIAAIGDCLRLPRQGFARRFGASCLLQLDRALGRLPDPRKCYLTAEVFCREYELNEEQSDRELLLNACRELLLELERFLLSRQRMVQRIRFSFFHLQGPATHLTVGCAQADRSIEHWCELLAIRLDRLQLPAAVIAIRLQSSRGQPLSTTTGRLAFSKTDSRRQESLISHLVERLSARIGDESVHGIMAVAEHRPQYAWRASRLFAQPPQCPATPPVAELWRNSSLLSQRPLWMLPEPRALDMRQNLPHYQGPLTLLDGPERLETGWWDDDGIARDYFVASNPAGMQLWIFRNRTRDNHGESGWYLHGMFG
ncbi:MAG: DNA polymerase Y family protein [Gammaproteobacteria bacterium]|nr:DNA polymerase Y family protein [Gammaproteobacteria bacterium]